MIKLNMQKRVTALEFDEDMKKTSIETLNRCLVDFSILSLNTKQAHWNLQGPNFIAIHEMLDDFYEMLQKYVDIFAERLVITAGLLRWITPILPSPWM